MTITTKFEPGSRVFSVSKVAGTWQAGGGIVLSITVSVPGPILYLIDADVGPNVSRKESLCFTALADAQDLAATLNE